MKQNGLEYEEIKKLLSIQSRKENFKHFVCEEIEDKNVEFCEIIEDQIVEFYEVIEDKKVVFCEEIKLIEDQKIELIEKVVVREKIEYKNVEFCEHCEVIEDKNAKPIEDQSVEYCEIIEEQKADDINMLKSSGNESDKINLTKKELKVIARKRGVKNYENL